MSQSGRNRSFLEPWLSTLSGLWFRVICRSVQACSHVRLEWAEDRLTSSLRSASDLTQRSRTILTRKYFLGDKREGERCSRWIQVAIERSQSGAIMSGYNRINREYATATITR
jgi:hypothetical protein